jgi:hypothetical protein
MPPPPPKRDNWESIAEKALPLTVTQDTPQALELRGDEDMEIDPGTPPLPYSSPCPTPTPGAAAPTNVDYSV